MSGPHRRLVLRCVRSAFLPHYLETIDRTLGPAATAVVDPRSPGGPAEEAVVPVLRPQPLAYYADVLAAALRSGRRVFVVDEFGAARPFSRPALLALRLRAARDRAAPFAWAAVAALLAPLWIALGLAARLARFARRPRAVAVVGTSFFADRDADLLAGSVPVERIRLDGATPRGGIGILLALLLRAPGLAAAHLFFADASVFWVALAARLAGLRATVALGGYDADAIPAVGYLGVSGIRGARPYVRWGLEHVDSVLPVADALLEGETRYAFPRRTGIRPLYGAAPRRVEVVPLGFDPENWRPGPKDERLVVSVAQVVGPPEARWKGFDLLAKTAARMPDLRFVLVHAAHRLYLLSDACPRLPPNLEALGRLDDATLRALLGRAKVFALPSLTEGMPSALCEAMLCGCVPVVSPVGAMPDVVGETGVVLDRHAPDALDGAIRRALAMDGAPARERIARLYPTGRRAEALREAVAPR